MFCIVFCNNCGKKKTLVSLVNLTLAIYDIKVSLFQESVTLGSHTVWIVFLLIHISS